MSAPVDPSGTDPQHIGTSPTNANEAAFATTLDQAIFLAQWLFANAWRLTGEDRDTINRMAASGLMTVADISVLVNRAAAKSTAGTDMWQ